MGLEIAKNEVRLCVYNKTKNDADTATLKRGEGDGIREIISDALRYAGVRDAADLGALVLTVPEVTKRLADDVRSIFKSLGLSEQQAYLQDFEESFFAHTYFQKNDVTSRDVGLFQFNDDGEVEFIRLHLNRSSRPAMASVSGNAYAVMPADERRYDAAFEAFIKENVEGRDFSSFFIVGENFDPGRAKNSLAILSKGQRRIFYGNNLFAKGACFSACEKKNPERLRDKLFLGKNLVRMNIGIAAVVDGIEMYYPLINAGGNWFESEGGCELLLNNDADSIVFRVSRLEGGAKENYEMHLDGLPERPKKTTRLKLELKFESAKKCVVTVSDLGFGELFPSSGKVWTDTIS